MRLTIEKMVVVGMVVVLGWPSFSAAETIYLQSGEKIEGNIIDQTDQYLIVDAQGSPGTYLWKDIKTVEPTPPQLSFLSQNSLTASASGDGIVVEDVISRISEEAAPLSSEEAYNNPSPGQLPADSFRHPQPKEEPALLSLIPSPRPEAEVIPHPENSPGKTASPLPGKQTDGKIRSLTDEQIAQALFEGAMSFVANGDVDKAAELLKQTVEIQPNRPDWHMNYGVLLLTKANNVSKGEKRGQARAVYREAYKELILSLDLFDATNEKLKPFISQCYFLLGEMDLYIFEDKAKAKIFYQKALEYSVHQGAQQALVSLMKDF